ncbi:MAG: arsenite methyltransferase [Bacteroidetes bacterium]|nr:arsenite methyltransferase [Bacteroidota bacterium]MBU1372795.1 arsenite methyltransferase [Bacteroidota bacterium]MBU1484991.1 arsenite methyltransferase [Bacteroidota bacterium]MBU1761672.1 arsenite methyltransferase [Bacteroidota bacterium]MBU2046449.1 arsenite methyltransferase [Bacteroidota bacterium]
MENSENIKEMVRQKYSEIALQDKESNSTSCCGATNSCSTEVYNIMSEDYNELKGYHVDANLGLGCGLPTQFAKIKKGDIVLDLGSGAGNDCFVALHETGAEGKVIGVDFTPAMIEKARKNAEKLGFNNVEFRQGDIESLPLTSNSVDVVVSNCVLNLVPDKHQAISEIARVLKPGGHFSISDVVLVGQLPNNLRNAAEMYAGCVSGALQKDVYLEIIKLNQFKNITIQKEKAIIIPDEILTDYLSAEEIQNFKNSGTGILSITVYAEKAVCTPGGGCC